MYDGLQKALGKAKTNMAIRIDTPPPPPPTTTVLVVITFIIISD